MASPKRRYAVAAPAQATQPSRRFLRRPRTRRLSLFVLALVSVCVLILVPGYIRPPTRTRKQGEGIQTEFFPPPHPATRRVQRRHVGSASTSVSADVVAGERSVSHNVSGGVVGGPLGGMGVLEDDATVDELTLETVVSNVSVTEKGESRGSLNVSAVVLFHAEYDTMNHTLYTWRQNGLMNSVAEIVFFLNGVASADEFYERLPVLRGAEWRNVTRVVPNAENLRLGLAITRMVEMATYENVLLLEKDWALIESSRMVRRQLEMSVGLLAKGHAHVVRFRHRVYPGAPLHARIMHENRESIMLTQQSNLFCYMHHWIPKLDVKYAKYFRRCEGTEHMRGEEDVICASARFCQWTNNPGMFRKEWFLERLGIPFRKDFEATVLRDERSNMLDFEFYTNWKADIWNDRPYVVALPRGLFEHEEVGEQNLMNTVWYAWNRLSTDVEEVSRALVETAKKVCAGERTDVLQAGESFAERFPLGFVRHYHFAQAMNKSVDEAVKELRTEREVYVKRLEAGHGTWRHGVTDFTNLWFKICLYVFPTEPREMKLGFVSGLFRMGEDDEAFGEIVEKAVGNIHAMRSYHITLFCDKGVREVVLYRLRGMYEWDEKSVSKLDFMVASLEDTLSRLLGKLNLQRIRTLYAGDKHRKNMKNRTQNFPSADHLAWSMAKVFALDSAVAHAEQNDGDAHEETHFIWFDSTTGCISEEKRLTPRNDTLFRSHIMLHALVTGVRIFSAADLENALSNSGFSTHALLQEMELRNIRDGLRFVDLKTFGGSKIGVTLMCGYYDFVLRHMLRSGELGTGREALSIAVKNVEYNFRFVEGGGRADGYMDESSDAGCALYGGVCVR